MAVAYCSGMMSLKRYCLILLTAALVLFSFAATEAATVKGSFVYRLSGFSGAIPYNWARVAVDRARSEVYVLYGNHFRIFDKNGMEIHRFGEDLAIGAIIDADIDKAGNMLVLAYEADRSYAIHQLNYRGEPVSKWKVTGLPADFSSFAPSRIIYRQDELYLAALNSMKVVVTDAEGRFKRGYDLPQLLQLDEKERADNMMVGFSVDRDGNLLFTIPTIFKAFIVTPDLKVSSFGQPGGTPGRFGVVSGITADERGNYLVVDKLKCIVMVFDKGFNFISEFGYRGEAPGNLIAPDDIAVDSENRIYVTQSRRRGINVYRLNYE